MLFDLYLNHISYSYIKTTSDTDVLNPFTKHIHQELIHVSATIITPTGREEAQQGGQTRVTSSC